MSWWSAGIEWILVTIDRYTVLALGCHVFASLAPIIIVISATCYSDGRSSSSNMQFVGFQPGPDSRGTSNIIFMCLSTLIVSVYAAIRIDVTDDEKISRSAAWHRRAFHHLQTNYFLQRLGRLCQGIAIPELLLFDAVVDYFRARHLTEWMRWRYYDFGPTLAFFVVMGGFKDGNRTLYIDSFKRMIRQRETTPSEDIRDIPWSELEDTICERSRSDFFVLTFAIVQLLWMGVQTIARRMGSLPVSPLEIITCAHAICAVPVYFLWRFKPHDVNEPIDLRAYNGDVSLFRDMFDLGAIGKDREYFRKREKFEMFSSMDEAG